MKDFVLTKSCWLLDLVVSVVFAACASFTLQLVADSGERRAENLAPAALVGGGSYLLAYLVARRLGKRFETIPSWVWVGGGGSLILIVISALLSWLIGKSVPYVTHTILIVILVVPFLLATRMISYVVTRGEQA